MEPFIKPSQRNAIRNILQQLLNVVYFAGDYRVYEATKESTLLKIYETFGDLTEEQRQLFVGADLIRGQDEINQFVEKLNPYILPFPEVTLDGIKKLFPKVKKLSLPELGSINPKETVYLGWRDVSTNTIYVVYEMDGRLVGVQCRYTLGPANRTCVCAVCQQSRSAQEVGLVTASSKRTANTSYGLHMCLDSTVCNQHIRREDGLIEFLQRLM